MKTIIKLGEFEGLETSCFDGSVRSRNVCYEIEKTSDGRYIFSLINGVTGYESFYLDSDNLKKFLESDEGWVACMGTKDKYNRLEIPASSMRAALGDVRL